MWIFRTSGKARNAKKTPKYCPLAAHYGDSCPLAAPQIGSQAVGNVSCGGETEKKREKISKLFILLAAQLHYYLDPIRKVFRMGVQGFKSEVQNHLRARKPPSLCRFCPSVFCRPNFCRFSTHLVYAVSFTLREWPFQAALSRASRSRFFIKMMRQQL